MDYKIFTSRTSLFFLILFIVCIIGCVYAVNNFSIKPSPSDSCAMTAAKEIMQLTYPYQVDMCKRLGGISSVFVVHEMQGDFNAPIIVVMCIKDVN